MANFVICEYMKIREEVPEFEDRMRQLKDSLISKASADWSPLGYGGMLGTSSTKTFSLSTIMPPLFKGMSGTVLTTWDQTLTNTGHQMILAGAGTGNTIYEDYKVGLAGLAFLDKALRISEIKMQISDKKLPRINIEEALIYEQPAIIFEEGFVLDEQTGFDLYAYVLSQGPQRIKPIGLQLNRVPNKLQVSNPGGVLQ